MQGESYDPSEYQSMLAVFTELLIRCQNAATKPLEKKKAEDIQKRLEVMKSSLASGSIPVVVLKGLTSIASGK